MPSLVRTAFPQAREPVGDVSVFKYSVVPHQVPTVLREAYLFCSPVFAHRYFHYFQAHKFGDHFGAGLLCYTQPAGYPSYTATFEKRHNEQLKLETET
jgi:hypothetical protein